MSDPIREAVSAAVEEVLEPLAQLAMEMQIGASDFIRLIEQAFIRAVEHDAALAGRPRPGASAVAARSGLTRQRVSQLRSMGSSENSPGSERQPQTLRILSAWKSDPKFSDRFGSPKILPVRGPLSFSALVKRHGSGLRARSILKELERIKAVRFTKDRRSRDDSSRRYRCRAKGASDPRLRRIWAGVLGNPHAQCLESRDATLSSASRRPSH